MYGQSEPRPALRPCPVRSVQTLWPLLEMSKIIFTGLYTHRNNSLIFMWHYAQGNRLYITRVFQANLSTQYSCKPVAISFLHDVDMSFSWIIDK